MTSEEAKKKEDQNPIKCSDLVGKIFYYFGVMSTIEKTTYGYRRFNCDKNGKEVFGAGVCGDGVPYFTDTNINRYGRAISILN